MENNYPANDKIVAPQKIINNEYERVLKEFKQELIITGYSEKTLKMYLIYIHEMLYHINKNPQEMTERDLIGYLADKKKEGVAMPL